MTVKHVATTCKCIRSSFSHILTEKFRFYKPLLLVIMNRLHLTQLTRTITLQNTWDRNQPNTMIMVKEEIENRIRNVHKRNLWSPMINNHYWIWRYLFTVTILTWYFVWKRTVEGRSNSKFLLFKKNLKLKRIVYQNIFGLKFMTKDKFESLSRRS